LKNPTDQRIFVLATALRNGMAVDKIHQLTRIDRWFLTKLKNISDMETTLGRYDSTSLPQDLIYCAKKLGFSDAQIARYMLFDIVFN
jgi:dimeric dUTPase (all-alpha-NTP-PPase superfamily)